MEDLSMKKTYISTRNLQKEINFYQAIVQGIGDDGGLLVPQFDLPVLDLNKLLKCDYVDLASEIISVFVPEDGKQLIHEACHHAYGEGLFVPGVVPVKKAGDVYIAELFHGQTAAFKDMALSLLPYLMTLSLKQLDEDRLIMILAATSGDTGKAALEGFKNVPGTCIKVFYPLDGVSAIQQQQMVSQEGNNVKVIGIKGNFDDAQSAVKVAFGLCPVLRHVLQVPPLIFPRGAKASSERSLLRSDRGAALQYHYNPLSISQRFFLIFCFFFSYF